MHNNTLPLLQSEAFKHIYILIFYQFFFIYNLKREKPMRRLPRDHLHSASSGKKVILKNQKHLKNNKDYQIIALIWAGHEYSSFLQYNNL